MVFRREANCTALFFNVRLSHLFLATTISFIICDANFCMHPMRIKDISNLHHSLVAGATTSGFSVLCGLGPFLPSRPVSAHHSDGPSLCLTLQECWCSRACFYFPAFLLKLRKKVTDRWRGTWKEQVLVHCFHFAVMMGGGKYAYPLENMLNPRMKKVIRFGQRIKWGQKIFVSKCTC